MDTSITSPGSHRYIDYKESTTSDGKSILETVRDESVCVMRPKYFVGSNGSVWASEDLRRLRCEKPYIYEVENDGSYSDCFRGGCGCIQMKLTHFCDTVMDKDIENVTDDEMCVYMTYEVLKLENAISHIDKGNAMLENNFNASRDEELGLCHLLIRSE